MAALLMRPGDGGSGDKKRRARKGKNAQKKQPQRGLGVAQLEKLRLQEQSLQLCPPSPAAFSLRLCAGLPDQSMPRCDGVAQTILSLTPGNGHSHLAGGVRSSCNGEVRGQETGVGPGAGSGVATRLCSSGGHSGAQSCLSPSVVQEMSKGNAEAIMASRVFGCLSQSSKFPASNPAFFSSMLTNAPLQMYENQGQAQQARLDERRVAAAGNQLQLGNAPAYVISTANNHFKEGGGSEVTEPGFFVHPAFKDHVGKYAVNGTNSARELSSFQNYSYHQAWSSPEKITGRKRPWFAVEESARPGAEVQELDLNAPVSDGDATQSERYSPSQQNQVSQNRIGAHYTTGVVRSALGNSCLNVGSKIRVCAPWQDSGSSSPASTYRSDHGVYSENGSGSRACQGHSAVKDSCSSATGSSSQLTLNGKQCVKDPESSSSRPEKESICSNFLTLGISGSSCYPDRSGCNEPEESIQDNSLVSSYDVSGLKQQQLEPASEGEIKVFPNWKSLCKQEVGVIDLEGFPSRCLPLDCGGGNCKRKTPVPYDSSLAISPRYSLNRFLSTLPPPSSMASNSPALTADLSPSDHLAYDPCTTSTQPANGALDLRLKLAL